MIDAIWKGLTLGFLLSISVGPVLFSILKQSINNGVKGGLSFIIGVSLSDTAIAACANLFTGVLSAINTRKELIGLIGSIFLISTGIFYLFFKKTKAAEEGVQEIIFRKRDYVKMFLSGFLMNTLNPSVIIFWLTTSTAFINHTFAQRIAIFATALLWLISFDVVKVFAALKIKRRLTPLLIHRLNQLNGLILIGFGIALMIGLFWYEQSK